MGGVPAAACRWPCAHSSSHCMASITCDQGHSSLEQLVELLRCHPVCLAAETG